VSQQDSAPKSPPKEDDVQPGVVSVGRAGLANVDFRKARFDKFNLAVANFVACDFRGLRLDEKFAPFFVTRPRSTFVSCKFDGADMRQVTPEGTRFEKCSFDDARLDGWTPARAEFVDCRFAGKVVSVTFSGRPAGPGSTRIDPVRSKNDFRGNDFRDAQLVDTVFVFGIDLNQQRWPEGHDYVRLDKFHRRLEAARADILGWEAGARATLAGPTRNHRNARQPCRQSPSAHSDPRLGRARAREGLKALSPGA
jgi:hypothetical protein